MASSCPRLVTAALRRLISFHVLLAAKALVTHQQTKSVSLLHIKQMPGAVPLYVSYGPPEFSTFDNKTSACKACVEFFPEKLDGKKGHSGLYHDENGGIWAQGCRAGLCDFRDPQTDPVGGIVGHGVGVGGKPDGRTCLTRDPVQWYTDCETVMLDASYTPLDVTRYCTYREQIFIPPPVGTASYFAGNPKAWTRVGGSKEQCMTTIEKHGSALFESMNFCAADLGALTGCCETMLRALNCLGETAAARGIGDQSVILPSWEATGMLTTFQKYCVPLCEHKTVKPKTCESCTKQGGLWCPKLKSCHCPSGKPPCIAEPITVPLKCNPVIKPKFRVPGSSTTPGPATHKSNKDPPGGGGSVCKYADFAMKWIA